MWPTSPAEPLAPRWIRPSTTIPAPIPVPILTKTKSSTPRPQPAVSSPSAITLTSLSTQTGTSRCGEVLAHGVAVPAGHDRRRDRPARVELDRAGDADPDPPQRARRRRPRRRTRRRAARRARALLRPGGDVGRLLAVDDDPAGEVGERDVGARRTEVGHEQVARVGAEAKQPRRPAARRDADAVLREQAVVDAARRPAGSGRSGRARSPARARRATTRRARGRGQDVDTPATTRRPPALLKAGAGLRGHFGSECTDICGNRQDFS